jgi:hypothetical protein
MTIDSLDMSPNWLADTENLQSMDFDDFIARSPVLSHVDELGVDDVECYKIRARYAVSRMKGWPAMFVQRGTTPFIHHSLSSRYGSKSRRSGDDAHARTEDVMLSALSACALYSSRNTENGRAAIQNVRRRAKALTAMMVSETCHSPTELLVFLQALSLYQIIRFFDGDIQLRAEAEADVALQGHWTNELMKYSIPLTRQERTAFDTATEKAPIVANPKDWFSWVFEESVRRVTVVSIMIQQNYSFLKRTVIEHCTHSDNICYTAQNALWTAPSEYHWSVVSTEKQHHQVSPSCWDLVVTRMRAEECDDISVILMALMGGLDSTAQWLGKENLVKYGLDWESMCRYLT